MEFGASLIAEPSPTDPQRLLGQPFNRDGTLGLMDPCGGAQGSKLSSRGLISACMQLDQKTEGLPHWTSPIPQK